MARPGFPLTIMDFQERFASEEACRGYLFECRWPEGYRCPSCGEREVGEMHRRRVVWQCKRCGHQTSVTAGTVMHKAALAPARAALRDRLAHAPEAAAGDGRARARAASARGRGR